MSIVVTPDPGAAIVRGDALRLPFGDASVDLIVTSPPYFALRSYSDGGEHYDGQIGSEPTPTAFLEALWAVTAECWRVLKPSGSLFVNLGDKYAGTGGGNGQSGLSASGSTLQGTKQQDRGGKAQEDRRREQAKTDRFTMPRNNTKQTSGLVRRKSLMNLPARYAIGCTDGAADPNGEGWVQRAEIIWSKPNGLPESVVDRVRRSHEQWFHFTKNPTYWSNIDSVRVGYADGTTERYERNGLASSFGGDHPSLPNKMRSGAHDEWTGNPLGKLPDDVWRDVPGDDDFQSIPPDVLSSLGDLDSATCWSIATQPLAVPEWLGCDHFAAFPTEWPRRLILGWCPPDGVVLDPFGGTGTTAMVARALGRFGVSLDLSADYLRLARWRIWQSGQAARVAAKTDGERQGVLL